ncbi:hypothetical protein [Daejeonella oryzae]|uniref:hypothetical protein n=1 Tax=Daejeonella oryzae TaxID=1122943 RepID=UPI000406D85B|nr:hypothetical protein [Daejeonella oryzae]
MKTTYKLVLGATMMVAFAACNNEQKTVEMNDSTDTDNVEYTETKATVVPGSYVDLNTGKTVYIVVDPTTGYAIDSISKVPVDFYINPTTSDTLYKTGLVVNHSLVNTGGKWSFDETKVKVDGDEIKIKDGDSKIKIDGEDSKVKDGDYKKKVDGDEVKIKDGDSKTKIEDDEMKTKSGN